MQRKLFLTLMIILSAMMFSITAAAQQRFSVSLNGRQQTTPNNSPGSGDCSIVLNAAQTQFTVTCNYRDLTSVVQQAHIHNVSGPISFDLTYNGGTSGTIGPRTFNATPTAIANLRSNRYYVNLHTSNFPAGEILGKIKRANIPYDYDGDGRTDIVVHRRSETTVYTLNSLENNFTATRFGAGAGDNFINNLPGDFDGDGRADHALIRVADNVISWVILQSGSNTYRVVRWGGGNDAITPSDYDGDGKLDIATFRRSTGIWYILESSTGNTRTEYWGSPNDLPVVGDYDGDGKADLCVIRGQAGQIFWYIRNSSNGEFQSIPWGLPGPDSIFFFFTIDVDNDGKQDLMVQRNEGGQLVYYVRRSSDGQQYTLPWGLSSYFPLFGDYDGDGKTDFVSRETIAGGQYRWHIFQSATQSYRAVDFGRTGDQRPAEQERADSQVELPVGSEVALEYVQ